MNSTEIYQFLEIIRNEGSTNVKIEYLKEFLEDDEFSKVVSFTYDPFITYGIKNISESGKGIEDFNENTYALLSDLYSRRLTGNSARAFIKAEFKRLNNWSAELFKMILNKDLKAGFNVKSINKACVGLIPTFSYMRCSLPKDVNLDLLPWNTGILSQEKLDGMFANLTISSDVSLHSRKGQPFNIDKFDPIIENAVNNLDEGFQYHGELFVASHGELLDRKTGNGILNSVLKGGEFNKDQHPLFVVWDYVPVLNATGGIPYGVEYKTRFNQLMSMLDYAKYTGGANYIIPVSTKTIYSVEEAYDHFNSILSVGKEGTILKLPNSIWKNGTSREQIKMKAEKEAEMRVIGMTPGSGKNHDTFGSLACISEDEEIICNVAGLTDKLREDIFEHWEDWQDTIISVKYNEVIKNKDTQQKSLFLPRFVERRLDRDTASYEVEFE